MSWDRGALTPCVSWGWRGLKKNVPPLRIISGTALNCELGCPELHFYVESTTDTCTFFVERSTVYLCCLVQGFSWHVCPCHSSSSSSSSSSTFVLLLPQFLFSFLPKSAQVYIDPGRHHTHANHSRYIYGLPGPRYVCSFLGTRPGCGIAVTQCWCYSSRKLSWVHMQAGNDASPDVYNLTPEIYQTWNNQEFPKNTLWAKSVTLDHGLLKKKSKCTNCTGHTLLAISIGIVASRVATCLQCMKRTYWQSAEPLPTSYLCVSNNPDRLKVWFLSSVFYKPE